MTKKKQNPLIGIRVAAKAGQGEYLCGSLIVSIDKFPGFMGFPSESVQLSAYPDVDSMEGVHMHIHPNEIDRLIEALWNAKKRVLK